MSARIGPGHAAANEIGAPRHQRVAGPAHLGIESKDLKFEWQWKECRERFGDTVVETTTAVLTELFAHLQRGCTQPLLGELRSTARAILMERKVQDRRHVELGQVDAEEVREHGFPDATLLACARAIGRIGVLLTGEQALRNAANAAEIRSIDIYEYISR